MGHRDLLDLDRILIRRMRAISAQRGSLDRKGPALNDTALAGHEMRGAATLVQDIPALIESCYLGSVKDSDPGIRSRQVGLVARPPDLFLFNFEAKDVIGPIHENPFLVGQHTRNVSSMTRLMICNPAREPG